MTFVETGCLQTEKHRGRIMAPMDAYSALQNRRDLSPAGAVVQERGTGHGCSDRLETDMHIGETRDTGIGQLAREPSCARVTALSVEWSQAESFLLL